MIRALRAGASVCVAVSLFDGLVLAKSSFSTSVNYRSALIYGQFAALETCLARAMCAVGAVRKYYSLCQIQTQKAVRR
jgi:nitroimidazol reductase NimA-like FMN-containing flavoprotein (pyridoxamine 5'-phosphate oxidase superfamily)